MAAICVPAEPLTPTTPRTVDRVVAIRTVHHSVVKVTWSAYTVFVRWAMAWSETVA